MNFKMKNNYIQVKCLDYFENILIPTLRVIYSNSENHKERSSNLIQTLKEKNHESQARLGWYLLILEYLCDISTQDQRIRLIQESIIDEDFNKLANLDNKESDLGVDVVYIDKKENNTIVHLFNFKYRENPSEKSGQRQKEALASYDFLSTLANNSPKAKGKTSRCIKEILDVLDTQKVEVIFHMVSNEATPLSKSQSIQNFACSFGIQVKSVTQEGIIEKILEKPKVSCCFILDTKDIFSFDENKNVKSIISKISALELIRISNKQSNLRNLEYFSWQPEIRELLNLEFEYGVLKDNVRGYIRNSINDKVIDTLQTAPNDFFYV